MVLPVFHFLVLKSYSTAVVERIFYLNVSCDVLQTAFISYDYLTAFKGVEYGTEDYVALKSKVDIVAYSCRPLVFTIHGTIAGSCLDKAFRSETLHLYWSQTCSELPPFEGRSTVPGLLLSPSAAQVEKCIFARPPQSCTTKE